MVESGWNQNSPPPLTQGVLTVNPACKLTFSLRVKLTLIAVEKQTRLPLDYQYAVASLLYATLGSASAEFASTLHDTGYQADGRSFKLFTFSRIRTISARVAEECLLLDSPEIELQISSPVAEFIQHLVSGLSKHATFRIATGSFRVAHAELVLAPEFKERMAFRALSPLTETVRAGEEHPSFLSLSDDWSEIMQRNLLRKYEVLYGCQPADSRLTFTWDRDYLASAERRGKRLSVLRDIRGTKIRGWLAPFTVEGSRALIELGYEAGFGARNSMGFGMAEPRG